MIDLSLTLSLTLTLTLSKTSFSCFPYFSLLRNGTPSPFRYFKQPGLEDKLRITVGSPEQNDTLLQQLKLAAGQKRLKLK